MQIGYVLRLASGSAPSPSSLRSTETTQERLGETAPDRLEPHETRTLLTSYCAPAMATTADSSATVSNAIRAHFERYRRDLAAASGETMHLALVQTRV